MLRCSLDFLLFTLPLRLRGKVVVWVVAAVTGVNGETEEANECRDEDAVKCAIAAMSHWQSRVSRGSPVSGAERRSHRAVTDARDACLL